MFFQKIEDLRIDSDKTQQEIAVKAHRSMTNYIEFALLKHIKESENADELSNDVSNKN